MSSLAQQLPTLVSDPKLMSGVGRGHGDSKHECTEPGSESGRRDGSPTPLTPPGPPTHLSLFPWPCWGHMPTGTNTDVPIPTHNAHNTRTHVLTHAHTHTLTHTAESMRVSRGCRAPRILSSARGAWEPWHSVQLSILSLCPLLGLPQGTGYQWPPLYLPPWQEKWLHRPPAQLAAWCLSGPRDLASLEMSPGPQGPGCRGQANPQSLPSSLPGGCPSMRPRQDTMRPACCKSWTLSPDLTSRFPGEDALDLGAGGGSLAAQAPGEGRPPGSTELPAACGP